MSRTVRALPTGYHHNGKRYHPRVNSYLKPTGRTLWYIPADVGVNDPDFLSCPRENFYKKYKGSPWWHVIEGFWEKTTEESIRKQLDSDILTYCKKNKTCRRQRKNPIRKYKQALRQQERAQGKRVLQKDLEEYYQQPDL